MKIRFLIALCCVLVLRKEVQAEGDDVKRGTYPFMAFVYYDDSKIIDVPSHTRFVRAAVLIRPDWLISSAIDHPEVDSSTTGFPRKTLLARAGAVLIDSNFTLNEDEDEQEREIIQIVRPYEHKPDKWWLTDITLLKTLIPFNATTAVSFTTLNPKKDYKDKNCIILMYSRLYSNLTLERHLMQKIVEIIVPANNQNCGSYFNNESMTCASDTDEKGPYDPDTFCQGNGGGPLICDNDVMGIQTYVNDDCKPPHLYQLLYHWETLISCSVDENCEKEYFCSNVCNITGKDPPVVTPPQTRPPTTTIALETEMSEESLSLDGGSSSESSAEEETSPSKETTTTKTTTETESTTMWTTTTTETSVSSWPKEAQVQTKAFGEEGPSSNDIERRPNVEAQQEASTIKPKCNSANRNILCLIHSVLLGYFALICVI